MASGGSFSSSSTSSGSGSNSRDPKAEKIKQVMHERVKGLSDKALENHFKKTEQINKTHGTTPAFRLSREQIDNLWRAKYKTEPVTKYSAYGVPYGLGKALADEWDSRKKQREEESKYKK